MGRRLKGHDYCAKCIYHITMTKAPGCPDFGYLTGGVKSPKIKYSPVGLHIFRHLHYLSALNPLIELKQYKIMPDHIHLLLFIRERMDMPLGNYLGKWKKRLHKEAPSLIKEAPSITTEAPSTAKEALPITKEAPSIASSGVKSISISLSNANAIFSENFHDRILFPGQDLNTVFEYIRANPYRLAVRRERPGFFRRLRNFRINGNEYQLYGNPFLLRNPFKSPVVIHRRYSQAECSSLMEKWLHLSENGGVIISPFISKAEKEILHKAINAGGRIIRIQNEPFGGERFKPAKTDFDLCAEGRLLLIAPMPESPSYHTPFLPVGRTSGKTITRTECHLMNALAEAIAAGNLS